MTIQYLVTTVKKTNEEIFLILNSLNICGQILVGNQLMDVDSEYFIKTDRYNAKIFNITSKGVSVNRNFLTLKSTADFIIYFDDDIYFEEGIQPVIENALIKNQYNAVRFNVTSDNPERNIKHLSKFGFVGARKLSSFGVCGIYFNREFLLKNKLKFREDVGPGTQINHGEDTLFLRTFLKKSKVFSIPELAFRARQSESTWQGKNRNLTLELYSHGYLYKLLYPILTKVMANIFIFTHMKCYPNGIKKSFLRKHMYKGIKDAKTNNKKNKNNNKSKI